MPTIETILQDAGKMFVADTRKALADNDINASGNLSRSINSRVSTKGNVTTLDVLADDYIFPAVQEGRGPTKNDQGGVLQRKIRDWVRDKPVVSKDISVDSLVFLISRKIHEEGTQKWQEFGSRGKTSGILEGVFSQDKIDKIADQIGVSFAESAIEGFAQFSNLE